MAAGRIKGITIEIGGDSTKLVKALSSVDNAISKTQQNLRDINKALKFDPSNVNLLKDKQQELGKEIEVTEDKIKKEKEALEQLNSKLNEPWDLDHADEFQKNAKAAENLKLQIDLDTAALKELKEEAKQSASVLGTQMQVAGEKIAEVGDKIKAVGDKIAGLGQTMTQNVTMPIAAAFGGAVKSAIDWESAFTGVMKTVDETATTTYDDLKKSINEIAQSTASSQNEVAAVMEIAGQLGVVADDIPEFTKNMIMLGDTTNLSAEEAASSIAKYANVTGMAISDSDRLGSVIVDLGNNFATTEADIVTMAQRLSGAGAQIGLSQGEILGFATALSSVGIEAEMGGSAFSKAMIKMQVAAETGYEPVLELSEKTGMSLRELELMSVNNTKDFKELADSLGLTATEMNATIKAGNNLEDFANVANMSTEQFVNLYRNDAPAALQAFIQGLGDVEGHGESTISMLQEMGFTEVRLRDTLTRLANSEDLVTDAVERGNQAWSQNDAMNAEAEKRYATMESKISQLKARITEVANEVGEMLMPYVEKLMDKIDGLIATWKGLDDEQKESILKFAAIAAAIGPVLLIVGKLVSSVGSIISVGGKLVSGAGTLITNLGGIQGVLAALTGPIGIVVAAVAALAAGFIYLYNTNDEFRASILKTVESLKENFAKAMEAVKPQLEALGNAFSTLMDVLAPAFEAIFQFVAAWISGIIETISPIVEVITNIIEFITNIIQAFLALLKGDTDGFMQYMSAAVQNFLNAITGIFKAIVAFWIGFFKSFGVDLKQIFNLLWEAIKIVVSNAITSISEGIQEKWNAIGEWLEKTLIKIHDFFAEIFDKMKEAVSEKITGIKDTIVEGITAAVDFVKELPEKFYNWGSEMITNLIDGIKEKISGVGDAIGGVAETIASYIHFTEPDVGPLSDFHTFMPDMINEMITGINKGIPRLENAMNSLGGAMASTLQGNSMTGNAIANNISINVYGAQGQNVSELADIIEQRIAEHTIRRGVAGI